MDLFNIIIISLIYLYTNSEMFFNYILKKFDGAVKMDSNTLTHKGEIIKYIIFILLYILASILF